MWEEGVQDQVVATDLDTLLTALGEREVAADLFGHAQDLTALPAGWW